MDYTILNSLGGEGGIRSRLNFFRRKSLSNHRLTLLSADSSSSGVQIPSEATLLLPEYSGGDERIRTSEGRKPLPVFETGPFNHSGTSPNPYHCSGKRAFLKLCPHICLPFATARPAGRGGLIFGKIASLRSQWLKINTTRLNLKDK